MQKDRNSIKLIELMPYGSFPVGGFTRPKSVDAPKQSISNPPLDYDEAVFWFENDECEVA